MTKTCNARSCRTSRIWGAQNRTKNIQSSRS